VANIRGFTAVVFPPALCCLVLLGGCGGGQSVTTPLPTSSTLASGTEMLYSQETVESQILMSTLTPASGTLGTFWLACPEDVIACESQQNDYEPTGFPLVSPPAGKYIYAAGQVSSSGGVGIWAYSIQDTVGSILPVSGYEPFLPSTAFYSPTAMLMDGQGKHLYFSDSDPTSHAGVLREFTFLSDTGGLQESSPVTTAPTLNFSIQAADTAGRYLYGWSTDSSGNIGISAFALDPSTGTPTEISGSPFPVAEQLSGWPWGTGDQYVGTGMALTPSGQFLYAGLQSWSNLDVESGAIYVFSIDPGTGAPAQIQGSPISLGENSWALRLLVHPRGKFLYVSGVQDSGQSITGISVYPLDAKSGSIPQTPATFVTIENCCGPFLIDPSGAMLLESSTSAWSTFALDASTGALTATGAEQLSSGASGVVVLTP